MVFKNKRASLELSIRAIVIVILAMTLLGLGLGFIRTMFRDISGITTDVSEQIRQQILDDLITNDKKLSFPKTQIVVDKGGSEILTVGIRNRGDSDLNYKMNFEPISDPNGDAFDVDEWFQYSPTLDDTPEIIRPADALVKSIRLRVPTSGVISGGGAYFLQFQVVDDFDNSIYAAKDFFIVIRG
jgi:hypothetical protein